MILSKKLLAVFMTMFIVFAGFGMLTDAGSVVDAATSSDLPWKDKGAESDIRETVGDDSAIATIVGTMYTFATYISGIIFGVSVLMIVWAGFKYATSQGETKVTEQAKMQIITAGIGIGVALFAMIIVKVFAEIYKV